MENIKTPSFKGCTPISEEWLDNGTFLICFADRNDKIDLDDTINSLYAEVHLDENNSVVIGENIYDGNSRDYLYTNYHCIGDTISDEIGMDENTANEIKEYALARMKTYM
jgi:hypothetical protein